MLLCLFPTNPCLMKSLPLLISSNGKWSVYADKEDSFSPLPSKAKTEAGSTVNPKPSMPLMAEKEDTSSLPPQRKPLFLFHSIQLIQPTCSRMPQRQIQGPYQNEFQIFQLAPQKNRW